MDRLLETTLGGFMFFKNKRKRLPLKTVYYTAFLFFIVIPILIVLVVALMVLNQQFKNQAIENIKRAQEAVIADLISDEDIMSMRLSHMIYTNDNEILKYAAGTDTQDQSERNEYEKKLTQTVDLVLEPVKDIISVSFYMKDGRETYLKNKIRLTREEIVASKWYQDALKKENTVNIGFYDTKSTNDLYMGNKKDSLILVFALAPDVTTDRSQKIEMVMYYQSTGAAERIKSNNQAYLGGKNKLGISQITGTQGELVFSTQEEGNYPLDEYICIKTPIRFNNTTWYIENYIKPSELTADFWNTALFVLGAAILILLLSGYYSRYFLRSIIKPIEEISGGLKQVEEGNLEVHISSKGQFEIRTMIHQFNAMVRRLKALVNEYEEKINNVDKSPADYFAAMIKGDMSPEEVNKKSKEFFMEQYALLGFQVGNYSSKDLEAEATKLLSSFERNPRFVSRCIIYMENPEFFLVFYRITEKEYSSKIITMVEELQRVGSHEQGVQISVCIGKISSGYEELLEQINEIRGKMPLRYLKGNHAIVNLNEESEKLDKLLQKSVEYEKLARALYIADEKNMNQEKEKMFGAFSNYSIEEIKLQVYSVILAIGIQFDKDNSNYLDVFGKQQYDYFDKIERIEDVRNIKLWITNYFAWIMDYSASKLNVSNTDVIVKAKRYIADHYEDAELSLTKVADYVELNEKYFSNRFTKETGETFSTYLTELRIQKSCELLKNTNFKVYEIAEMVGYYNVEHFNRMFKRQNGISPAQYRKST